MRRLLRCSVLLAVLLLVLSLPLPRGARAAADRRVVAQQAGDDQATALAQQVLAGGDGALPALQQAVGAAGFTILGDDDSTVITAAAAPSQGLSFGEWEIEAMLASEQVGFNAPLDSTGYALAAASPVLDGAPLGQFLLDGVQAAANGDNATLRFWARFIVALGQQAQAPTDPLSATDPAAVQLDAIQLGLIDRRLAGDLYAFSQTAPAGSSVATAVYQNAHEPARPAAPCTMGDAQSIIMDATATATTYGYGELLNYLKEVLSTGGQVAVGIYANILGASNLVLAYGKLAWALHAFQADFSMDPQPLVRTKEQRPMTGGQSTLTAKVKMDIGNSQILNCFRVMLNAVGLDFSLPNGGALKGAELYWEPRKGFVESMDLSERIVAFAKGGYTPGQPADMNGVGTVVVDGFGQQKKISDSAAPIIKHATLNLRAVIKPANVFQDLVDASAVAAGGPLGLLGIPSEMLQRNGWGFERAYTFPVQDWAEWTGTITQTETQSYSDQSSTKTTTPPNITTTTTLLYKGDGKRTTSVDIEAGMITAEFASNFSGENRTSFSNAACTDYVSTTASESSSGGGPAHMEFNIDDSGHYLIHLDKIAVTGTVTFGTASVGCPGAGGGSIPSSPPTTMSQPREFYFDINGMAASADTTTLTGDESFTGPQSLGAAPPDYFSWLQPLQNDLPEGTKAAGSITIKTHWELHHDPGD